MDDAFFMNYLDALDHLNRDVKNSFEVELMVALLEKIFQRLSELVHHHDVIHFAILSFFIAHEMKIRHCGLSPEFMDQL